MMLKSARRAICIPALILVLCLTVQAAENTTAASRAVPGRKYLIVHSDDAGMSHNVNLGTIEGMEKGIVTSASIMVPCPWFTEFAAYASKNKDKDFGIHLTYTSEWDFYRWGPVSGKNQVPSMADDNGYMWDNVGQVVRNVKLKDAERELRAQIDRAKKHGVEISHLDPHMGAAVSRPDLLELYVKLGIDYKIPVLFSATMNDVPVAQLYRIKPEQSDRLTRTLESNGLPVLDALYQFYFGSKYESRKEMYLNTIRNIKPGFTEIIIHCGVDNEELKGITSSNVIRDTDRRVFIDPDVIAEVKKLDIHLTTWKEFKALKSAELAERYGKQ